MLQRPHRPDGMPCTSRRSIVMAVAVAMAGTAIGATPVHGQFASTHGFGINYVANAPDLLGGAGGYVILPILGGLGIYADAKFDIDSPTREDHFDGTLTARAVEGEIAGVEFIATKDSWRSFNAALVRPVSPALMVYAGAGVAVRTRYREYRDPAAERGLLGFLLVEAPDEEWTTINGLAGAFLGMSSWLAFQIGVEARPRGITVGASFRLPPR